MKIPKSLLQSILVGVTACAVGACSLDIIEPPIDIIKSSTQTENEQCPPDGGWCPACGMG